jgi:hypothetical protein
VFPAFVGLLLALLVAWLAWRPAGLYTEPPCSPQPEPSTRYRNAKLIDWLQAPERPSTASGATSYITHGITTRPVTRGIGPMKMAQERLLGMVPERPLRI